MRAKGTWLAVWDPASGSTAFTGDRKQDSQAPNNVGSLTKSPRSEKDSTEFGERVETLPIAKGPQDKLRAQ